MDFPWGSLRIPQLVIPINTLSKQSFLVHKFKAKNLLFLRFPRWPPNVVAINTFQPQIRRKPMGFGEGISTIWQDDELPCVNESTSQLSLRCSVSGAHLGTRESSSAMWLGIPASQGWGGGQARASSPRGRGVHPQGPCSRSRPDPVGFFMAVELSSVLSWLAGPPVNVSCNIFINSFGSIAETTMVSKSNTSCCFMLGLALSLKYLPLCIGFPQEDRESVVYSDLQWYTMRLGHFYYLIQCLQWRYASENNQRASRDSTGQMPRIIKTKLYQQF